MLTVGCADTRLRKVHGAIQHLGNAEVAKNEAAVAEEEDVLRFQIAMQHLVGVHVMQAERQLDEPVQDLGLGKQIALGGLDLRGQVTLQISKHTARMTREKPAISTQH